MRISDWSSDVCSSDLGTADQHRPGADPRCRCQCAGERERTWRLRSGDPHGSAEDTGAAWSRHAGWRVALAPRAGPCRYAAPHGRARRSEEHTSELQSLMRISYAVFCLKKKKTET